MERPCSVPLTSLFWSSALELPASHSACTKRHVLPSEQQQLKRLTIGSSCTMRLLKPMIAFLKLSTRHGQQKQAKMINDQQNGPFFVEHCFDWPNANWVEWRSTKAYKGILIQQLADAAQGNVMRHARRNGITEILTCSWRQDIQTVSREHLSIQSNHFFNTVVGCPFSPA